MGKLASISMGNPFILRSVRLADPEPIVDHTSASKQNIQRIKAAYAAAKGAKAMPKKASEAGREDSGDNTTAHAGSKRKAAAK